PGDALAPGVRFRVRIEEAGIGGAAEAEAPDAQYPALGGWDELGAEDTGTVSVVLVPFRYDTDGSGRLPDTSEMQLARVEDELTSRFPYARVDLRVHAVVPWSRSTRIGGNVDWGAVNSTLISMRDREGAHPTEYWYGLVAPNTSRSAYCDDVYGSCVTGQAYVATLRGSRVGSGVGFDDVASVRTLAHELGHEHGRYHTPCGTSGTDEDYPHRGGLIGTWGWDRRTGAFHAPDVGTDMMGYCSRQWISDYTYRAMYDRQMALRAASWSLVGAPVARRFVTVGDGDVTWGDTTELRALPGDLARGAYVDAQGRVIAADVEIGALELAHGGERVWVVPASAPDGAVALLVGDDRLPLP
ncbi:MAG: M66 family metalloprotease, partial [Myxococcota bacterium]|nr:M66 family metalloprotease [Myxococcota bacterium]